MAVAASLRGFRIVAGMVFTLPYLSRSPTMPDDQVRQGVLSCCPVCPEEPPRTTDNPDNHPDRNPDNRYLHLR